MGSGFLVREGVVKTRRGLEISDEETLKRMCTYSDVSLPGVWERSLRIGRSFTVRVCRVTGFVEVNL